MMRISDGAAAAANKCAFERLRKEMAEHGVATADDLVGCSEEEVARLEGA